MSHNPYRAPLAPGRPALAAATFTLAAPPSAIGDADQTTRPAAVRPGTPGAVGDAMPGSATQAERRRARVRRVRSGIGLALVGHGVAVTLPVLPALIKAMLAGPDGDGTVTYAVCAVLAQFLLAAVILTVGVRRTAERDGAGAVGLALGWLAGAPAALVAGIAIGVGLAL